MRIIHKLYQTKEPSTNTGVGGGKIMKLMSEAEALGSQAVVNANQYK